MDMDSNNYMHLIQYFLFHHSSSVERELFKKSMGIVPPLGNAADIEKRMQAKQSHLMQIYKKKGNLVPNPEGGHSLVSGRGMPMIRYYTM